MNAVVGTVIGENNQPLTISVSGGTVVSVAISGGSINDTTITNTSVSGGTINATAVVACSLSGGTMNGTLVKAGGGTGTYQPGGLLFSNVVASSNVGTGETTTMTYTLPASSLTTGKSVEIKAWGVAANNANTKTIKMYAGTAVMVNYTAGLSNPDTWLINAYLTGTGTDTQAFFAEGYFAASAGAALNLTSQASTAAQTTANTIVLKVTCQGSVNADLTQNGMIVKYYS